MGPEPGPAGPGRASSRSRTPAVTADLVPVRHGRMMASPFTFYRGAAKIMAVDLAGPRPRRDSRCSCAVMRTCRTSGCTALPSEHWSSTSTTSTRRFRSLRVRREALGREPHGGGLQQRVQPLPQAFDITQGNASPPTGRRWPSSPGCARSTSGTRTSPRTSCGRHDSGHGRDVRRQEQGQGQGTSSAKEARKLEKRFEKNAAKARSRDSLQALDKLTEVVDGTHRIVSNPPVLVPRASCSPPTGSSPTAGGDHPHPVP